MSTQDRIPPPDRFEDDDDWLDQFDDDPAEPRLQAAADRAEAALLDDLGLDWTDMERRDEIEIGLDHAEDVDDPAEDDIAA